MRVALDEVTRRRATQEVWNAEHGILPKTVYKPIREGIEALYEMDYPAIPEVADGGDLPDEDNPRYWKLPRLRGEIERARADMLLAAGELRFEEAGKLRDRLAELEAIELAR